MGLGRSAAAGWAEHIARRTVAFFFLTSLANVAMLIGFALLYATGVLHHDRNPPLTYAFGVAGVLASAIAVLGLPRLRPPAASPTPDSGRLAHGLWFIRHSLGHGVTDGLEMLRRRPTGILAGSLG